MEELRAEIEDMPEPASIESMERFASEILEELGAEDEITLEKKRKLFEMMHVKVILHPDGNVNLEGWFNVPEHDGLLPPPSARCDHLPQRLRGRA